MKIFKLNTSATVKMGPFISSADGVSPLTTLTITSADVRLSKNGGNFVEKNDPSEATHDEDGYYDVILDTTDLDTLERMRVAITVTSALPVWNDFMVSNEQVYDSLYGTDKLEVDIVTLSGTNADFVDFRATVTSASNLDEVDITGQTVSASNLDEVDVSGQSVLASATNLDEVDITGQSVLASATNLDEVDITGQSVLASATNLDEVDITGQTVSASNLDEVDVSGQSVLASATNLDEVDVSGQAVSANNLDEVDVTGQSVLASATNLDEVDVTGQSVLASATNLDEVDVSGQSVLASATNLDEVDVTGQSVLASATNLDEIDLSNLATSAALQAVDNNVDTIVSVLPPAGDIIAGQNDIDSILVNTRFKATVPSTVVVPETGYYPYELIAHLYNSSGSMEDPDNDKMYVQIKAVSGTVYKNELYDEVTTTTPATSGTNPNFQPEYYEMVKVNTGFYHLFYKVSASEEANQWVATFGYEELSAAQYASRTTVILESALGESTLADNATNKTIIRESMGLVDGAEASIDDKLNDIYSDMGTSATQETINTNVLLIPTDNNGITVSASNLDEVDITGQTVSASNLSEVDINGQTTSASNLDEVSPDANLIAINGISTSANDATLSLKQLHIVNDSGHGIEVEAGSGGTGISVKGDGTGEGLYIESGLSGTAGVSVVGRDNGIFVLSTLGTAASFVGTQEGAGLFIKGGTSGHGIDVESGSAQGIGFVVVGADANTSGFDVSAINLGDVDISGQTVSASNLDEVDITGQSVLASATNLDEVDISGQTVSASNLDEVDITGQSVLASATNLDEVDISGQTVSASNLDEVDVTGQSVLASATNLDEVDINGQTVSASNLDEVDINGQTTSASNLNEVDVTNQFVFASATNLDDINVSADALIALHDFGTQTSAYADIIKDELLAEINDVANEVLISATVDGSVNVTTTLLRMLSMASGKIIFNSATDEYVYFREDNITSAFGLSGVDDLRTRLP
tara:strand:- start:34718 stop:37687 length:2970 start_codon:yes stop_codon:yes gene_type:complete